MHCYLLFYSVVLMHLIKQWLTFKSNESTSRTPRWSTTWRAREFWRDPVIQWRKTGKPCLLQQGALWRCRPGQHLAAVHGGLLHLVKTFGSEWLSRLWARCAPLRGVLCLACIVWWLTLFWFEFINRARMSNEERGWWSRAKTNAPRLDWWMNKTTRTDSQRGGYQREVLKDFGNFNKTHRS